MKMIIFTVLLKFFFNLKSKNHIFNTLRDKTGYVFINKTLNMANLIKTKRGLDIQMNGKAVEQTGNPVVSSQIAMIPDHYHGITPKMIVKEGDSVKAGSPVFYDKLNPEILFVSPVSGKVLSVNRGERRKIVSIIIENDGTFESVKHEIPAVDKAKPEDIQSVLQQGGLWPFIKQRPYDVIAHPKQTPKAIFISAFDSAPLAPNNDYVLKNQLNEVQIAISALSRIAKVHLGIRHGKKTAFSNLKDAEITAYEGPHPIGNAGVQINQISPVNKGEVVWTIHIQDVAIIGKFLKNGFIDFTRLIALTGPEVIAPQYYPMIVGSGLEGLLKARVSSGVSHRFISGNVLTGLKVAGNEWLDPYATQVTVVAEGNNTHELFGWAMPRFNRFSASKAYSTSILESKILTTLIGKVNFKWDTRVLGGRRAIIMSGEYDKVLPMDIYPEFLFKAMIVGNLDKMEALGAYEIAPEDVALCEFVCTSKLPLQQIVRSALDNMRKELE